MNAEKTRKIAQNNCSMCGRAVEIMEKGICAFDCRQEFKLDDEIEKELTELEEKALKQTPIKAIKTETSSQACPNCNCDVNWKYCSNCGQAIEY